MSALQVLWLMAGGLFAAPPGEAFVPDGVSGQGHSCIPVHSDAGVDIREAVDCLIDEVDDLIARGELDRAGEILSETENLSGEIEYIEGLAKTESKKGDILIVQGRYQPAIDILSEAYQHYSETDAALGIGNLLASAHRFQGNYQEAFQLYTEVLETVREMGDSRLEAGIEQNLAVVHEYFGDVGEAMERYYKSLELAESEADTSLQLIILNNLGELFVKENEYSRAVPLLRESLDLSMAINSPADISRAYLNLGNAVRNVGELEEAIGYYEQSLAIATEFGNVMRPVQILFNMGRIYLEQEDYERAEGAFHESLDVSRQHNIVPGLYYNNTGLGDLFMALNEIGDALDRYEQALDAAERLGVAEWERTALKQIWQASEQAGRESEAFAALKRYQILSDSLHEKEREEAVARYETLFDLRSERRKNELLEEKVQARNATIFVGITSLFLILSALMAVLWMYRRQRGMTAGQKRQNRKLSALYQQVNDQKEELAEINATKNKLFSVLAHDLRSPVSQLQALVYMINEGEKDQVDQEEVLKKIDKQLFSSIQTLENYLNWAQSQLDGLAPDLQPVNLHETMTEVFHTLEKEASGKGVDIQNRIDKGVLVRADENMIRIILQNLISNSVKYSHSGDIVTVSLLEMDDHQVLTIKDMGVGIPQKKQEDIFKGFHKSRKGTNDETGTGLGLSICREFAEKQGAGIWFESREGEGTTFFIKLRKAEQQFQEV